MNNTIINLKENMYSIDNISKICHKKSLNLLIQSIEKLDEEIKDSKDRKILFDIKGFYKRTIITVHGIITYKRRLLNKFVITQTNKLNFKEKLLKVIYDNFEINDNTKFYICGDGATWIESLTEYFPNSTFVIDKFHYLRALTHLPNPEAACDSFLITTLSRFLFKFFYVKTIFKKNIFLMLLSISTKQSHGIIVIIFVVLLKMLCLMFLITACALSLVHG